MRYYANPTTGAREAMTAGIIDCIVTPTQGNRIPPKATICADNGCFGKGYPGDDTWYAWLQTLPADRTRFAVAPDVVGAAAATLERSRPWLAKIRALGLPAALVAQNGLTPEDVPWDEIDVLFLGGSPECVPCGYVRPADAPRLRKGEKPRCPYCHRIAREWKLGVAAFQLVREAKTRGKWVHMGRVNSERRYTYAAWIGCDSADGTFLTFGPDRRLPDVLAWLRTVDQLHLFGIAG